MNLFTQVSDDFTVSDDLFSKVDEIGEFASNVSENDLKALANLQRSREFELWQKTVRHAQQFAYEQGLREHWWEVVHRLDERRRESFWTPAWDSAYDYAIAMLLKPWAGVTWPAKEQEMLISPLRSIGLNVS